MALTAFALSIVALPIYAQTQGPAESTNQPPVVPTEMVIELEHKVKKGETLYAIGKHYHCSVAELQALNPGIGMLKPGMKVKVKQRTKVPAKSTPAAAPQLNPIADRKKETPVAIATLPEVPANVIDHVVVKGQSLYSISKTYGVSIAEIKSVNKLTSDQLSINQKLWIPKTGVVTSVPADQSVVNATQPNANPTLPVTKDSSISSEQVATTATNTVQGISIKDSMDNQGGMPEQVTTKLKSANLKEYEKKVTAQIGYEGMKAERSWVMMNKHKKGEVVAIINPVNKKMVYCTVIGELPDKGNKHIAISQSVADRLGITEGNATLRVRYVAQ
ncbi:MAG: hypothetical protein RL747_545 [Bacteroidota bacterium]